MLQPGYSWQWSSTGHPCSLHDTCECHPGTCAVHGPPGLRLVPFKQPPKLPLPCVMKMLTAMLQGPHTAYCGCTVWGVCGGNPSAQEPPASTPCATAFATHASHGRPAPSQRPPPNGFGTGRVHPAMRSATPQGTSQSHSAHSLTDKEVVSRTPQREALASTA